MLIKHPAADYADRVDACELATDNDSEMPAAGWLVLQFYVGVRYNADSVIRADPDDEHGIWGSDLQAELPLTGSDTDWALVTLPRGPVLPPERGDGAAAAAARAPRGHPRPGGLPAGAARAGLGKRFTGVSHEAMQILLACPWKGNVRELDNALQRAVILFYGRRAASARFDFHVT